jgi:esterase
MIEFERYGHGKHKVLGIHGWFGDEISFKSLELSLDPAEFECAWLAHRGYGLSINVEGNYDMAEIADDAIAVADSLGWKSFSVIGHSMGGKAAQLVAVRAPGRVRKLVAAAPVPADPVPFDAATRLLFENAAGSAECRATIVSHSIANRLSATWVNAVVQNSLARSRRDAFTAYFASWADDDFSAEIKDVDIDTLVLVGAHDPVISRAVSEHGFASRYASLQIKELENSGHYPMDEVPLLFGAEVLAHLSA